MPATKDLARSVSQNVKARIFIDRMHRQSDSVPCTLLSIKGLGIFRLRNAAFRAPLDVVVCLGLLLLLELSVLLVSTVPNPRFDLGVQVKVL